MENIVIISVQNAAKMFSISVGMMCAKVFKGRRPLITTYIQLPNLLVLLVST